MSIEEDVSYFTNLLWNTVDAGGCGTGQLVICLQAFVLLAELLDLGEKRIKSFLYFPRDFNGVLPLSLHWSGWWRSGTRL